MTNVTLNPLYERSLIAKKKSPRTIASYTYHIQQMLVYVGKSETEITYADLIDWQASISDKASATVSLKVAAVKSYFKCLAKAHIVTENVASELEAPEVKHKEKPYMTKEIVKVMLDNVRTDRDKAIIMLMASTGVRVSELTALTMEQYQNMAGEDGREIVLKQTKRGKERTIYINDETKLAIDCYLAGVKERHCDKLFLSFQGGQIHSNNLALTIKSVAHKAGIPFWEDVSNHTMRAAFATIASDSGVPVATISKAMGHNDISTTSRYIKSCQNNINNAMKGMTF